MYVWNGFTIIGKRADCSESLLVTIEAAEEQLRNDPRELIMLMTLLTTYQKRVIEVPQGLLLGPLLFSLHWLLW